MPSVVRWLQLASSAALTCAVGMGCAESHSTNGGEDAGPSTRITSGWVIHPVAESGPADRFGLGMDPSLTIDAADRFHLTHVHQDRGDVLYSHGVPGAFETERVGWTDGSVTDIRAASHALGPDGTLHVVSGGDPELGTTHSVRHAGDGSYARFPLAFEAGPPDSRHPSVGLLPDGTPIFVGAGPVSMLSPTDREIHAIEGSGEPVMIATAREWRGLDIWTTVTDEAHVHALVQHLGGVFLATRTPDGRWGTRSLGADVTHAALTATSDGVLHAALVRAGDGVGSVSYGRGPMDGSGLEEEPVASIRAQGPSIAVSSDGAVHIAWDAAGAVHYASNRTGEWRHEEIETVSTQNGRPVIALDSSGTPWIAYRDAESVLVLATPERG